MKVWRSPPDAFRYIIDDGCAPLCASERFFAFKTSVMTILGRGHLSIL